MIEEKKTTRYRPVCDSCDWRGDSGYSRKHAEYDLRNHKCGEHREQHDFTGGYRGILGGYNRYCVCGERYVSEALDLFKCPKDRS